MKQLDELKPMPVWAMIVVTALILFIGGGAFLYVQNYAPAKRVSDAPPVPANTKPTAEMREASFGPYEYSYARQGNTVIAIFYKKFLPRDDAIFQGAADHVIKTAFGEATTGKGSMMDYGNIKAIKMQGKNHTFGVVPIKEDTGEIHSLKIDCIDC